MRTALASITILLALWAASPADANAGVIQPGDVMSSSVGGCTLNFVYDGVGPLAGRVFIGTAAHCVNAVGNAIDTIGFDDFGVVAAIGSAGSARTDWAIIEVKDSLHHVVSPAVKGHPGYPTGVTTSAPTGGTVQLSGYGMVFSSTPATQERRVGVLVDYTHELHRILAPVVFGDSGGPIVHVPTGTALGLNSRIPIGCPCSEYGPTIEGLILQAGAKGFPIQLRTV